MEVILLEKVANLGGIGDRVKVRPGYGRNFLLPQGKATVATAKNIAAFEARRADLERKQADELKAAEGRAEQVRQLVLRVTAKAGPEGKLFGSLGTVDIAESATKSGVPLLRSEIRLPGGPIRTVGTHEVDVHLHADLTVSLKVEVVSEEAASA